MTLKLTEEEERLIQERRQRELKEDQDRRDLEECRATEQRAREAHQALMTEVATGIALLVEKIPAEDLQKVFEMAVASREDFKDLKKRHEQARWEHNADMEHQREREEKRERDQRDLREHGKIYDGFD